MHTFIINSDNRHAARKLLVAAGHSSSDVRNYSAAVLATQLSLAVQEGKYAGGAEYVQTTLDGAAYKAPEPEAPATGVVVTPVVAKETPVTPGGLGTAPDKVQAVNALLAILSSGNTAQMDPDQIRKIVREEIGRPLVIHVKSETGITKLEGEFTHEKFPLLVRALSTRGRDGFRQHVWIAGEAGSGKSHGGVQAARAVGLNVYTTGALRTKFELIGYVGIKDTPEERERTLMTPFRKAFQHGGAFVWDDVDGSAQDALVAFLQALANGHYAFPDGMVERHRDFVCIATANTWGRGATAEYVGRARIDAAFLDRFAVKLEWNTDESLETALVGDDVEARSWVAFVQKVRGAVRKEGIKMLVTQRASLGGAAMLANGFTRKQCEELVLFPGVDGDTRKKILAAA